MSAACSACTSSAGVHFTSDLPQKAGFAYTEILTQVRVGLKDFDPSTGILTVPVNLANVVGFRVREAQLPRHGYPVVACTFTMATSAGAQMTVSVPGNVNYDVNTLATALTTAMQTAASGDTDYAMTYSTSSGKYTASGPAGFSLDFSTSVHSRSLNYALGFGFKTFAHTASGTTIVASGVADIQNGKLAVFSCAQLTPFLGSEVISSVAILGTSNSFFEEAFHFRRFKRFAEKMSILQVTMQAELGTTEKVPFDNRGLYFYVVFEILSVNQQFNLGAARLDN